MPTPIYFARINSDLIKTLQSVHNEPSIHEILQYLTGTRSNACNNLE
jgi:hypothetical protein